VLHLWFVNLWYNKPKKFKVCIDILVEHLIASFVKLGYHMNCFIVFCIINWNCKSFSTIKIGWGKEKRQISQGWIEIKLLISRPTWLALRSLITVIEMYQSQFQRCDCQHIHLFPLIKCQLMHHQNRQFHHQV
jgi:hypothetical protein